MSEGRPSGSLDIEALAEALEQLHVATGALVQAVPALTREGWDFVSEEPSSSTSQPATSRTFRAPQVSTPKVGAPYRFRPCPPAPVPDTPLLVAPVEALALCVSLPKAVRAARALRTWNADISAGNVLKGLSSCVDRTPDLAVRSRLYVVLQHSSGQPPALYLTYSAFKAAVGALEPDWSATASLLRAKLELIVPGPRAPFPLLRNERRGAHLCVGPLCGSSASGRPTRRLGSPCPGNPCASPPWRISVGLSRWQRSARPFGRRPSRPTFGDNRSFNCLLVPGAEESEEGMDVPVEEDLQVLVVDYDDAALQFLTPFDPALSSRSCGPFTPPPRRPSKEPPGLPKTKAKAKRVTAAQLADQLGSLLTLISDPRGYHQKVQPKGRSSRPN